MNERVEFANQLRGIACLAVLISHYFGVFWTAPHLVSQLIFSTPLSIGQVPWIIEKINHLPYFVFSSFGVSLFFLISGFVIPFSLKSSSNAGFALRRFLRIYPLYIIAFMLTVAVLYSSAKAHATIFPYTWKQILIHSVIGLRNFFFVPSIDGIIWTLEIEVKFYLLCLAFRRWLFDIRLFLLPLLLLFAHTFLKVFATAYFNYHLILMECHFLIYMLIGTAYYLVYQQKISFKTWCVGVLCILGILTRTVEYIPGGISGPYFWSQGWALLCFLAAATLPKLVNFRILSFYARISFPLYLIHGASGYVLMTYLHRCQLHPWLTASLATVAATLVAYGLHLLFERKLLALSKCRSFVPQIVGVTKEQADVDPHVGTHDRRTKLKSH